MVASIAAIYKFLKMEYFMMVKFILDEYGATSSEYAVLVALIGCGIISTVIGFKISLQELFLSVVSIFP